MGAFALQDPAAVPVFGLAFGAAGLIREARGPRRKAVLAIACVGIVVCLVGAALAIARRLQAQ
jgi:hypothetical protein